MSIDLHCHTHISDGSLSPSELIRLATERNIQMLSITDHDSIDSYAEIAACNHNLTLVPGIEFSSLWRKTTIHIVGLNIDLNNPTLLAAVAQQSQARAQRAEKIAKKLHQLGFADCLAGAKSFSQAGQVGRPHFAQYLVSLGAVSNVKQAFKRYLGAGKPGDIKQYWADLASVVGWIRAAGGIAVLAHPSRYSLTAGKLCALIEEFIAAGGEAMEVICGTQTASTTRSMAQLCCRYDLLASCGSDFHSLDQPWSALGMVGELPPACTAVWSRWR